VRTKTCFVCGSKSHLIKDCDVYDNVENFPSIVSNATSVPAGSKNSSAFISTGRSIPAASKNRPTSIHAGRHIIAGRFNKPAPFPAGRSVPTGWTNHVARPFFRPTNLYFDNISWPKIYDHMSMNEGRWGSAVHPHVNKDIGIVDSGCSRSMTGNKEKLADFVQVKGGTLTFGGRDVKITGKGTIRTSKLNFENIYYMEELQHISLSGSPYWDAQSLETVDGRVIYMFVDVSYPLSKATLERMLRHSASESEYNPLPYALYAGWEMVPNPLGSIHAYYDTEEHTKHFTSLCELLHMVEKNDLRKLLGVVDNLYQRKEPDTFALIFAATLKRMLKHGLEVPKLLVEGDLTMAEQLVSFIKAALLNAQSVVTQNWMVITFHVPFWNDKWLVQGGTAFELASPEQTATGKDVSNPFMAVMVCQKPFGYFSSPMIHVPRDGLVINPPRCCCSMILLSLVFLLVVPAGFFFSAGFWLLLFCFVPAVGITMQSSSLPVKIYLES
nr:hypothetical protein [Tanacetum cinerariifolium]